MKLVLPIILLCLGFMLAGVGYLFRIMHWPGAMVTLLSGSITLITGLVLLIVAISKNNGSNN